MNIHNAGPSLTESRVEEFERKLGSRLPEEYRSFLLQHNGGEPRPAWFGRAGEECQVTGFFSLGLSSPASFVENDLDSILDHTRSELALPRRFVPIASVCDEDLLLLCVSGREEGEVYYWGMIESGYEKESLRRVAASFTEFTGRLQYPKRCLPWMELIDRGDMDGLRRWLEAGGDPGGAEDDDWCALDYAITEGRPEIVRLFAEGRRLRPGVFLTALNAGDPELAKLLLRFGAGQDDIHIAFATPATWADPELPELLLQAGADLNFRDPTGRTPIHNAAYCGSASGVRWLLEHGARPNCPDSFGRLALHDAVQSGDVETVKALLDAGEDLHASHKYVDPDYQAAGEAIREFHWALRVPLQMFLASKRRSARRISPSPAELMADWDPARRREVEEYLAARSGGRGAR